MLYSDLRCFGLRASVKRVVVLTGVAFSGKHLKNGDGERYSSNCRFPEACDELVDNPKGQIDVLNSNRPNIYNVIFPNCCFMK